MNARKTAAIVAAMMLLAAPALADWDPGDPYKMHYPQLPDPQGWDVTFLHGPLADDWLCTQTGPVEDIHIWVSFREDYEPSPQAVVGGSVEIWGDVPANVDEPFSHPLEQLWGMGFDTNMPNVTMRLDGTGDQGWLDPVEEVAARPDHTTYYQINIDPVSGGPDGIDPFIQKRGEIYWLVAHMFVDDPAGPTLAEIGWKTSIEQYRDDAVYTNPLGVPRWLPLVDPISPVFRSLDLAFVITVPEPGTILLLMFGVAGLFTARTIR